MIRCVLTDIEGTTSSIEFVHKILFPYARSHLEDFLRRNTDPEVVLLVQKVWTEDLGHPRESPPDIDKVTAVLKNWIDKDLKHPTLKTLQGKIWKEGYERQDYLGHVYPEVSEAFREWNAQKLVLAIYSSGSIEAQKLLFAHSEAGDLTPFISKYYDTGVGAKRESKSYVNISIHLKLPAAEILFLSDIKEELDAAAEAGMKTVQLLREPLPQKGRHPTAKTFDEVKTQMEAY